MINLSHKYTIGTHIMFYEIEMYEGYIQGLINLINTVENHNNIHLNFCLNISEHFEVLTDDMTFQRIIKKFKSGIHKLKTIIGDKNVSYYIKDNNDPIYTIADYRRDLNYNYCNKSDIIMWGETDSFFPKQAFQIIDSVYLHAKKNNICKFILNFADRKLWDSSWDKTVHIDYVDIPFIDDGNTHINKNYAKSELSIDEMNHINSNVEQPIVEILTTPKIDGSCLTISSELIKSGINIPHSLLLYGEDTSFGEIAKKIMGDKFIQFSIRNILKVHARRHSKKRMYIKNEDNPYGFCGNKKGEWSEILNAYSKHNLYNIFHSQEKFFTFDDVFNKLK